MVIYSERLGVFLCAWYNSPLRESVGMRVLMASSPDLVTWTDPIEVSE